MDQMVLKVQQWLNNTYSGVQGFTPIPEELYGKTGWTTMYALTRALQHELGITVLVDNFGNGTKAAYERQGLLSEGDSRANLVYILQGGLLCKGYNPGGFTGTFGPGTRSAVMKIQSDTGMHTIDGVVYSHIFKAILTMDAYILIGDNGDSKVRAIQQALNASYYTTAGIQPCDGIYSRNTNKSLMYGIQTEEGISAAEQTGSMGPTTKSRLPYLLMGSSNVNFVRLLQFVLYLNGYDPGRFDGEFDAGTHNALTSFQNFTKLPLTGTSNTETWLSLLVSTGDPNRIGTACDCVTEITQARAQTLKSHGYTHVGRYLTNVVGSTLNKKIQPGELNAIFNAGLSVFPIYQTYGGEASYFSAKQGEFDAKSAYEAAKEYGFKNGTTIYFSVDFDAYGKDITNNILPHFKAIHDQFVIYGASYNVGVYGARNICIQVSEHGWAKYSFVSGMSTGFSGNLGYPLPSNWAFDQISTITIGSGEGKITIDNDINSGRDLGQSSIGSGPASINYESLKMLRSIFELAMEYTGNAIQQANYLVSNYYKKSHYDMGIWAFTTGGIDQGFVDFVKNKGKEVLGDQFTDIIDPITKNNIDIQHLMATLSSLLYSPDIPFVGVHIKDLAGWAGDLFTVMIEVYNHRDDVKYEQYGDLLERTYRAALDVIGTSETPSHFSYSDYAGDMDALNIAKILDNDITMNIFDAFYNYYESGGVLKRIQNFFENKFSSDVSEVENIAITYLNDSFPELDIAYARNKLREDDPVPEYTKDEGKELAKAWKDKLLKDLSKETL
ncbi:DUF1906 domain-containing protein [Metabacillus sp. GX 13764]|uniref:glycoside hydrolase domain-containing protein n=1 Tax=Metabacillus kandeliae TaxID=2900151 RepID=UPI001E36C94E|nr:glycoside hydrolase domain-containing protein [Metabacillus kandeliae]MCD7035363.1 DUF1906 domain-containing protein [Metabacillus kandeliae]